MSEDKSLPDDAIRIEWLTKDEIVERYGNMVSKEQLQSMQDEVNKVVYKKPALGFTIPAGDGIFPIMQQAKAPHWQEMTRATIAAFEEAMIMHYLTETNSVRPRFVHCGCFTVIHGIHTRRQAFLIRNGYYLRKYGGAPIEWRTTPNGRIVCNRPILF